MRSIAPQLHIVLGSISAMLVAFLALINGTSPTTCVMKATAAFLVFAGFGLILRFALADALTEENGAGTGAGRNGGAHSAHNLDMIVPGTSVAELLASQPRQEPGEDTSPDRFDSDSED
ncbi:MAG TPA: hypothetical protein VFB21_01525 [Chthonomonadaceae bacterium]|nr:hypothetical protein [Chthonomonadaceae bacterium]